MEHPGVVSIFLQPTVKQRVSYEETKASHLEIDRLIGWKTYAIETKIDGYVVKMLAPRSLSMNLRHLSIDERADKMSELIDAHIKDKFDEEIMFLGQRQKMTLVSAEFNSRLSRFFHPSFHLRTDDDFDKVELLTDWEEKGDLVQRLDRFYEQVLDKFDLIISKQGYALSDACWPVNGKFVAHVYNPGVKHLYFALADMRKELGSIRLIPSVDIVDPPTNLKELGRFSRGMQGHHLHVQGNKVKVTKNTGLGIDRMELTIPDKAAKKVARKKAA